MDKKISVIIPVYNAEKYLTQTLDCIRSQTYRNLEIICVLDCPTDNSGKIAEEFAKNDERFVVVKNPENRGPGKTRNNGTQHATGEYLHFMDSDDLLSPGFYESMINAANEADADISACSVFYEKKPKQSIWLTKDEVISGKEKIYKSEVLFRSWVWRYLIKKSFWDRHHFSFPDLALMEDAAVSIPVIHHANRIAFCSEPVYFYKNRENSILNKKENNPERKELRKKEVQKAKKTISDLMRLYKMKRPNKLLWSKERITGKFTCINDPVAYGKTDKKISVLIPVYNVEKYLKQTLDSIRSQTYRNLEIVCILDCPTDNSAKTAAEAAKEDNRIKLIEHSKNRGLPAARNTGVENATGEYIHFMDSDDLLSPDFYEIMISAAEKADADVSACSVFYEKKQKRSIWFQKSEILSDTNDKIEKTEVTVQGWAWRYLIKKSFWDAHQFFFPDLVPMEDKPVMIPMIFYANRVALCPGAVYFYKNRENSILNKQYDPVREKKRSENRQQARKIFKDFMRVNKIRRPSKWLYYIKKYFA
jgi:glycosyltransferase involved in cell wall biosynthesis